MKTNVQKLAEVIAVIKNDKWSGDKENIWLLDTEEKKNIHFAQAILSAGYVHKDDVELDISKELRQAFLNSKDPEIRKHINEIQAWRIESAQSKDVIKIKETK